MKAFLQNKKYVQPKPEDRDFMVRLYQKKEYYMNRVPKREIMEEYEDIKQYRDNVCKNFSVAPQQSFVSSYINPNTNNMGLLVFHGVGSGKTCAGIRIAEGFKEQVKKYGTKIYVLVPGTIIKEGWKRDLLGACTQGAYLNPDALQSAATQKEQSKLYKQAIQDIFQYYRIMSHKSFYKRVLGEKMLDKRFQTDESAKKKYLTTESGDIQREYVVDKIENLDNSILIVDEAQKIANNEFGAAIWKIKESSKNLRIVLLSATPTKNIPHDLIYLLNTVRPIDDPIVPERVFKKNRDNEYVIQPENIKYLEQKVRGYVSYYRGAHPLTFAEGIDMGAISPFLEFTPVVRCPMSDLQLATYNDVRDKHPDDTLLKRATSVSNFVVPALAMEDAELVGYYGEDGYYQVMQQLKHNKNALLQAIKERYFEPFVPPHDILFEKNKQLHGLLFHRRYIAHFSTKFHQLLHDLDDIFERKKNPASTAFIYSDYVKTGVEMIESTLLANGYLPFNLKGNYNIRNTTICYLCATPYEHHSTRSHDFHPATYLTVTGGDSGDELTLQDEKFYIISNIFNDIANVKGKQLKVVVGSRVMNEGVTLENIGSLFIMDANHNLNQIHQAIGRGLRYCKHYNVMTEENPFPKVRIYRYVVSVEEGASADEEIYAKAERKYKVIKIIERILKQSAIDCPFFLHANVYPEDVKRHDNCLHVATDDNPIDTKNCPAECDFTSCHYVCTDPLLNQQYLNGDGMNATYGEVADVDYATFSIDIINAFITKIKFVVKKMYRFRYVYTLKQIKEVIRQSNVLREVEDDEHTDFYIYKALTDLVPVSENDFNNLRDIVFDKYNTKGYLIHRGEYYVFQPFHLPENTSLFYRMIYQTYLINEISLGNYIKNNISADIVKEINKTYVYDFNSNKNYYENRGYNDVYGVIDKMNIASLEDSFKLKQRGVGTDRGMVCTSHRIEELRAIYHTLRALQFMHLNSIVEDDAHSKEQYCEKIAEMLFFIEKYSTGADKKTFMVVPANHLTHRFPLNLEDAVAIISKTLRDTVRSPHFAISSTRLSGNTHRGVWDSRLFHYRLTVTPHPSIEELLQKLLPDHNFRYNGDTWSRLVQ